MAAGRTYLVVSSRPEPGRALEAMLARAKASVSVLDSEKRALEEVRRAVPSAVFLDADDPARRTAALCRRLRTMIHPAAGAVVVFGRPLTVEERVRVLDEGADDYWSYPFNEPVCLAYLRAILRRVSPLPAAGGPLEAEGLRLDPAGRQAALRGRPVGLRSKEFDLLCFFLRQKGKVLTREALMENVWGQEYFGATRTIDFHIAQLRRKLGRWARRLETVPGAGYRCSAGSRAEPDGPGRPGQGR